ncbi:FAD binding domain-containing protein [Modestobacter sp. VKM Ac-2985]|uniref:FAD binding domain-containing protein n=1 Tax=Modestobacter sp. VKM Ac-2985 TaxID=3004139 RepID=UPI0022ABAE61|nr:xanthine dehydrogenase family protein subunit M [Modestobacter sp. VKM Ac-2985]MCZ2837321.1 xanthine dehydrogenase family protein subunit M [Modestobacter sp. VKM Ac-2985]
MKPAPFDYRRARSVADALGLLAELGGEAKVIAGGQSLMPMMAFRLARPSHLVDIGGLGELRGLWVDDDGLHIGALTTHHQVETCTDPAVLAGWPVLPASMSWIGHLPIRTLGTVGGSVAHGDALAEWCLLTTLLDAVLVAEGADGRREIPVADFFLGFFTTALLPDELLVEVRFPAPAPHAALTEYAERHGDYAIVSAAVSLDLVDGSLRGGRIALGGVADAPVRVPEAEALLTAGTTHPDELGGVFAAAADAAAAAVDPGDDQHGSADYRRSLVRTLVQRAGVQASVAARAVDDDRPAAVPAGARRRP